MLMHGRRSRISEELDSSELESMKIAERRIGEWGNSVGPREQHFMNCTLNYHASIIVTD